MPISSQDLAEIEKYARQMHTLTGVWGIFLDYEYNSSQEKYLNVVCCSVAWYDGQKYRVSEYWLHNNNDHQLLLGDLLQELNEQGHVMIAYSVGAEGRATLSLNGHPSILQFKWVDLYLEWLQCKNKNNDMMYGKYIHKSGFRMKSVPPSYDTAKNKGKDNTVVPNSLSACVYKLTGDIIDTEHKTAMRDLVILNKPVYTDTEQTQIMDYCTSDIKYLARIWYEMTMHMKKKIRKPVKKIFEAQLYRGDFGCSGALMETVGTPVNDERLLNLRNNHDPAVDEIITDLVENYYPFFVREKKYAGQYVGDWVDKMDNFVEFIKSKGLYDSWPRTFNKETKKFTDTLKRDGDTLEKYDNIPEILKYRRAKKNLKQLGWLRKPHTPKQIKEGDFFDSMGSDIRIRTFLGLYGTQTARNAPKAKRFILAMSSWLRSTIKAPPGYVIVAVDYSSQEFAIAAIRAKDNVMIQAYLSGDPYSFFCKHYGSIPKEANNAWIKDPSKAPTELQAEYKKHKFARSCGKSTTLGVQFGMRAKSLAIKLTVDTGVPHTEADAQKLLDFHEKLFKKYWDWQEVQYKKYVGQNYLDLPNGWCLLGDNDNSLSVKNFGVQGYGSAIMQDAVMMMHRQYNAEIICPLHDAVYTLVPDDKIDEWVKVIDYCMTQAVYKNLGDKVKIRLDIEIHKPDEEWIEEKGEHDFKLLNKYFQPMMTRQDRMNKLKQTIFRKRNV